jgi:hypothetical protein
MFIHVPLKRLLTVSRNGPHNSLESKGRTATMPNKNIARAEDIRILKKGQRSLYIADMIWMFRIPEFIRSGAGWVLGVVWVCA